MITKTIYLNREKSEQFLKQNAFLTYFSRFLRSNTLEQLDFELEKIIVMLKPTETSWKTSLPIVSYSKENM